MKQFEGMRLNTGAESSGKDWWSWAVWLEGPEEQLDRVESVRYALHPTFPKPVRVVRDRKSGFRLSARGWGEFRITAVVTMKDGQTIPLERWLTLGEPEEAHRRDAETRPKVFVSHSGLDRPLVGRLSRALEAQGVEVVTPDELGAESFSQEIRDSVESADVAAFLVSGELRGFAEEELEIAERSRKAIVPILLHPDEEPPRRLADRVSLSMTSPDNLDAVADALAARAKDEFYEK